MQPAELEKILKEKLTDCEVKVGGDDYHFEVTAIGERFSGLSAVKKQQAVYACINDLIVDGTVHAVSIKTFTPAEWADKA